MTVKKLVEVASRGVSRRFVLQGAAAGVAASSLGFPNIARAQGRISWDRPIIAGLNGREGDPTDISIRRIPEILAQQYDIDIIIEIYPSSQLAADIGQIEGVQNGLMDIASNATAAVYGFTDAYHFMLGAVFAKEIGLAQHRADAAHLEHQPLHRLVAMGRIDGEELTGLFGQIEQDRAGLEDGVAASARSVIVDDRRDLVVRIDLQELGLELVAGGNIDAVGTVGQAAFLEHALRNAWLPVVTMIGLEFGFLLGGVVVVETVFSYPGIGRLVFNAINQRDIPVVQASVILIAVIFILLNLIVDLIYARLDPRVKY